MQSNSSSSSPSLLSLVVILVVAVLVVAYVSFSIYARDPLWFWPKFAEQPAEISIRCYGKVVLVERGSMEFTQIAELVNAQLSGDKSWNELPLTPETYQTYLTTTEMVTLHLDYLRPVSIHTGTSMFIGVDKLLIPLAGRHAKASVVFGLMGERPTGGSVRISSTQPIQDYLMQSGLCPIKGSLGFHHSNS